VVTVHRLSLADARRIAVRAQLLSAERPTDLVDTVRRLTMLQLDPVSAIAPSADLVLWSRLGSPYDPRDLRDAVDEQRLIELDARLRPAEDLVLYRAEMEVWPGLGELKDWQVLRQEWLATNEGCHQDIVERLRADGPLTTRELPDTCVLPWSSTGWTGNKNVQKMLDLLVACGEVAVAGRRGRDRLWDLATRVYPDEPSVPLEEALRIRSERRLRSLGIARSVAQQAPGEPWDVGEVGEPAVVDGVPGEWRVDPAQLGQPFTGRTALLSPFDRLVHDRKRMTELFEFDYYLEMYKPAAKRRWGYYALPILHGDRLVGKLDARADRKDGELQISAVHQDVRFTKAMSAGVEREIRALAQWLGLAPVTLDQDGSSEGIRIQSTG
jgi:uncharacterized protein YcaQ